MTPHSSTLPPPPQAKAQPPTNCLVCSAAPSVYCQIGFVFVLNLGFIPSSFLTKLLLFSDDINVA